VKSPAPPRVTSHRRAERPGDLGPGPLRGRAAGRENRRRAQVPRSVPPAGGDITIFVPLASAPAFGRVGGNRGSHCGPQGRQAAFRTCGARSSRPFRLAEARHPGPPRRAKGPMPRFVRYGEPRVSTRRKTWGRGGFAFRTRGLALDRESTQTPALERTKGRRPGSPPRPGTGAFGWAGMAGGSDDAAPVLVRVVSFGGWRDPKVVKLGPDVAAHHGWLDGFTSRCTESSAFGCAASGRGGSTPGGRGRRTARGVERNRSGVPAASSVGAFDQLP